MMCWMQTFSTRSCVSSSSSGHRPELPGSSSFPHAPLLQSYLLQGPSSPLSYEACSIVATRRQRLDDALCGFSTVEVPKHMFVRLFPLLHVVRGCRFRLPGTYHRSQEGTKEISARARRLNDNADMKFRWRDQPFSATHVTKCCEGRHLDMKTRLFRPIAVAEELGGRFDMV